MFSSLRGKLFASYVLIAVLSVIVVALASGVIVRNFQHDSQVRELDSYALLMRTQISRIGLEMTRNGELREANSKGGLVAIRNKILDNVDELATNAGVRLLLVDRRGTVITDSLNLLGGYRFDINKNSKLTNDLEKAKAATYTAPNGINYLYVSADLSPLRVNPLLTNTVSIGTLVLMQPPLNPLSGLIAPILFASGIALLLSLLAAFVLGRTISRPVQRLKVATTAIAAGDYDHKLDVRGSDELAALAHSFNQMTAAVQGSQQSQRDFLANISHDLKTPLTSIQGFSQAIMDDTLPDLRSQQGAARVINEEAQRMGRLVNALLEISRLQSGQLALRRAQLDPAALLQACVEGLEPQARAKDVSLGSSGLRDLLPILGDDDRLRQVFTNLTDNAIRHTPPGGWVEVTAENGSLSGQPALVVKVADGGEGIPEADLPRIFERFYQVDKARTQATRGLGLGLSIVKEVIEAHGGTITVASRIGHGTTFTVTLPSGTNLSLPSPATLNRKQQREGAVIEVNRH